MQITLISFATPMWVANPSISQNAMQKSRKTMSGQDESIENRGWARWIWKYNQVTPRGFWWDPSSYFLDRQIQFSSWMSSHCTKYHERRDFLNATRLAVVYRNAKVFKSQQSLTRKRSTLSLLMAEHRWLLSTKARITKLVCHIHTSAINT